jgi:hypothetical protein
MPFTAIIGGAAVLGGGIIGAINSSADRNAAQQAAQNAVQEITSIGAPPDLAKQILLKHFESAGLLTPAVESAINQGDSSLSSYTEDPNLKNAQMGALSMLQQRGHGGLTAIDRAAFNDMRAKLATDAEGKRQQILQNFAQRGLAGSGAELAAQLQAQSSAQNQASQQGDAIAAAASQRALEAMTNAGQLGGQMRGQDFGVAQGKAQSQDAINRFNAANSQDVQARNVAAQNQSRQYNLANNQRLLDSNTNMDNAEQYRQADAQRQYWQDQLNAAAAKSNAYNNQATNLLGQANSAANMYQKLGTGLGGAVASYGDYSLKQQKLDQQAGKPKQASSDEEED